MHSIRKFRTLIQCPRLLLRSVPVVKLTQKSGPLLSITAYVRNVNTNKLNFSKKKAYYVTLAERQCWKCGRKNGHDKQETFFCKCGIIQEVPDDISYFDIMEIDESFDIESNKLSDKLKALQRKLHPDKFAQRSDEEMRISANQSSIVNKAYQTLSKPLNRGLYLLKLHGHIIEEDNTDMDPIFLLEIMECNEAIADVETPDAVQQLKIENTIIFEKLLKEASTKFLSNDFRSAKEILAQAKYYDNILEKLKIKMGDLGIVS